MLLVLLESEDIIPPDPTFTYIRESLTKKIIIKQKYAVMKRNMVLKPTKLAQIEK